VRQISFGAAMDCSYDVAIIGAGPAGLAAACRLVERVELDVIVVDAGCVLGERTRTEASEVTIGQGGAGLYSDGKFSFFPSASELWALQAESLASGYDWVAQVLGKYGVEAPPFPSADQSRVVSDEAAPLKETGWHSKRYPSSYISLQERIRLIGDLVSMAQGAKCLMQTRVGSWQRDTEGKGYKLGVSNRHGDRGEIQAEKVIIATGRFGPLDIKLAPHQQVYRRLEVGMRIEQPSADAFFSSLPGLDPKLKLVPVDGKAEWRTFCACRDGETVVSETGGLWTVSGRADCPPSGRSNIGFNTRILDPELGTACLRKLMEGVSRADSLFTLSASEVLAGAPQALRAMDAAFGKALREQVVLGLASLAEEFPSITLPDTKLIGPTLEGVGWYPLIDEQLQFDVESVWVAGDVSGTFRGIVAAMISGHFAAARLLAARDVADGQLPQAELTRS